MHAYKPLHMLRCGIMCPSPCSHIRILRLLKKAWLIYVYINYNAYANACAYRYIIKISHYIRSYRNICITNKWCPHKKHNDQDDKMNTLAFVNCLLVKIFPTLIGQYFPRQNFAPYGICKILNLHVW